MPIVPRFVAAALAFAGMLAVCGCVPTEPDPSPAPTVTEAPVFASEQEALAAATEAYAAYQETSDLITSEGGASPDRLAPFVTSEYLEIEQANIADFQSLGLSSVGKSSFDSVRLQDDAISTRNGERLGVYLCYDVSRVRLVDSDGADATPADRPNRLPLVVQLRVSRSQILVDGSEVWSGKNFC